MNKKLIKIILLIFVFLNIGINYSIAEETNDTTASDTNVILVTEKIPGANCSAEGKLYRCEVGRGFSSIMYVMGEMLKYFTFLAGLFSVLSLVIGGIMYSMGGANESMKNSAKDYIQKSLMGLIVLLLSGVILYMVAPWVYV